MDENNDKIRDEFGETPGGRNAPDWLGIIALIAGIVSFLFTLFLAGGPVVGVILAIVAILFATFSIHRVGKTKIARAGRILGIIGIVVVVLYLVLLLVLLTLGV